jgi:hypothetical protein
VGDVLPFILIAIAGYMALLWVAKQEINLSANLLKSSPPCKMHQWMLSDSGGWLPEEATAERQRAARLRCYRCRLYPDQISTDTVDYDQVK